jgi:murein L,D-transpeptidase YafK
MVGISARRTRRLAGVISAWAAVALLPGDARSIVIELDDVAPDRIERQRQAAEGQLPLPGTPDVAHLSERLAAKGLEPGREVFIRIFKMESELELWMRQDDRFVLLDVYPICHWAGTLGPKIQEGDKQNPEGFYTIGRRQIHRYGRWHQALNVGFPNIYDRVFGRTGSYILLHGGCSSVGCFAMTDPVMSEIFSLTEKALQKGQQEVSVHIFPFRMTEANLEARKDSPWTDFWHNLKEGYDAFEATHVPPNVGVCGKRYGVQQVESAEPNPPAANGRRRDSRLSSWRRFDCSGMATLGNGEDGVEKSAEDRPRRRGSVVRRISHQAGSE